MLEVQNSGGKIKVSLSPNEVIIKDRFYQF
jgi:ribosome-associated protein YbcJ (S4-like RNA binding protein)